MAGRNLSRVFLKALPAALKVILHRIAHESLTALPDLDGLVAYPALKRLPTVVPKWPWGAFAET